jgi:hypothetical protein
MTEKTERGCTVTLLYSGYDHCLSKPVQESRNREHTSGKVRAEADDTDAGILIQGYY